VPPERETIWAERAGLWLGDEAVFVEPPGDLFEDAGNGGIAAQVWQGLLSALRRNRPRQPLNGIILALPLPDLLQRDEAQLRAAASHLRERLREVHTLTGQNLPVYLVLTQSDRLAGFEEFFDSLPADQRSQVLGITLPVLGDDSTSTAAIAALAPEFEALVENLNQYVPGRLHQEPDITRRGLAFAFPQQLALARGALELFVGEVFRPSRYEERRLLRGVYFTSSEQGGDCVDLMRGAMVGLVPEHAVGRAGGWNAGVGRRDFFIASVLRDVVLRDATAIGVEPGHERRRRRHGAMVTFAMVVLGGLLALAWRANYADTHRLIDQNLRSQAWASQVTSAMMEPAGPDRRIDAPAFDVVAQPLRSLRASRDDITAEVSSRPMRGLLGLYQGARCRPLCERSL
jgi:type VI secretion system protein ImpL